jgi:tetratricopeptide (TPR) repeat protein
MLPAKDILYAFLLGFFLTTYLPAATSSSDSFHTYYHPKEDIDIINVYFENFEDLSKSEKWEEIISQGKMALETARKANRFQDEAKICAQLTSTAFYLGDYNQALMYANRCHELSEAFIDPSLFLRALYLESAVYRALASKSNEEVQETSYSRAVEIAEEAISIYSKKDIKNITLEGKIYFNLGAAHADNPKGDLKKAVDCYSFALYCFQSINAHDDIIRTNIRLGKVHLLQKNYDLCQQALDEVRPMISIDRLSMHADYLEAQLKLAINDIENAIKMARNGLEKAITLGAKEDELRLRSLLQNIEDLQNQ